MKFLLFKGITLIISINLLVLTSCSKTESSTELDDPAISGTYIKFNLMGVVDVEQTKLASRRDNEFKKLTTIQPLSSGSELAENIINIGNSLDALTSVSTVNFNSINNAIATINDRQNSEGHTNNINSLSKNQVYNKLASTIKPLDGKAYKVILFDDENMIMPENSVYSSRQAPLIQVQPNKVYRWVVISMDDSVLPEISPDGIIAKRDIGNKNILYASGTISTSEGENPIRVILQHHRVRYDVMLDARGVFGSIKSDSEISIGYMKDRNFHSIIEQGDLDLRTGEYTNVQTIDHIALGSMMRDTLTTDGSVKKYSFYTVSKKPVVENSLTLKFKKFGVEVSSPTPTNAENKATRSFDNNRLATFSHEAYSHSYNGYYDIIIRLIDAGMPVEGLVWARTNLIYEANKQNKYVFRAHNDFKGEPHKDYWNFRAETTGISAKASTDPNFDPCAQVYPQGLWRTPTLDDFKTLGRQKETEVKAGLLFGMQYIMKWGLDNGATVDNGYVEKNNIDNTNDRLRLTFGGYREPNKNNIKKAPWGFLFGALGSGEAHYWTQTSASNQKGYLLYCDNVSFLWTQFSDAKIESGNKDVGRFIRCVRGTKNIKKS